MSHSTTSNYLALVIKSRRIHERDLLLTLLTPQQGKILVAAPGVRHLTSTKKAYLETGNLLHAQLVTTKGLPLLTQATLVTSAQPIRVHLASLRRFLQFIEILDSLFVNEELSPPIWRQILFLRELFLHQASRSSIQEHFSQLLATLGYSDQRPLVGSICQQVGEIIERPLHAYDYLSP
jgi:DNA repair protein RecO